MQPINDLHPRIAASRDALRQGIDRVLDRGWLAMGPEVKQFESSFADYLGVDHCVGVASGTDALELALRAVGVAHDQRVATAANAGMYTATALMAVGAQPHFVDVDARSCCLTINGVRSALDQGVHAVVLTHLYGLAAPDTVAIAHACRAARVPLIEDVAQAHGAALDGRRVGSFGDAAAFSFYPTKNLGALGDGGAVVTGDDGTAARLRQLHQYGWSRKYHVELANARNSRLDELQAAALSVFLPQLDAHNAQRRAIAARYTRAIKHPQVQTPAAGGPDYVAHLYVVTSPDRDALHQHLTTRGVASAVHYPIADHRQPVYTDNPQPDLPVTDQLTRTILTLPCYPEMTDDQVDHVIASVNAWPA